MQLIDSRNWRDDADLAQVYTAWGGFAYGRGLDGAPAADDMNRQYRRIAVAAKNTDTREHDIADSDDYFQYHGGMVATVRALTGQAPEAYIGDNTRPDAVRTRTLSEETTRVFRARVVNPRWMTAMRRHGYKGAFEMAATVDYLFGYDATAGVMADWMYERLTEEYVLDDENRKFMAESNPWALHGMAERLLEAADRGMWAQPEGDTSTGCGRCCWKPKATSKADARYVGYVPVTFADIAKSEYILLTTFTKDGRAQADGHLGGPQGRWPGGHHAGEIVEGQAHPQHPAGDDRGVRPERKPEGRGGRGHRHDPRQVGQRRDLRRDRQALRPARQDLQPLLQAARRDEEQRFNRAEQRSIETPWPRASTTSPTRSTCC